MERVAFKMQLHRGKVEEYKRRHDELWPDLRQLLKEAGIEKYSIFLDEETHSLIGVLNVRDKKELDRLSNEPIMKKWWSHMKDIMETNPDNSPVSKPLNEVFYLP